MQLTRRSNGTSAIDGSYWRICALLVEKCAHSLRLLSSYCSPVLFFFLLDARTRIGQSYWAVKRLTLSQHPL